MQRTSATCYFAYNDAAVHANARNHPGDDIKRGPVVAAINPPPSSSPFLSPEARSVSSLLRPLRKGERERQEEKKEKYRSSILSPARDNSGKKWISITVWIDHIRLRENNECSTLTRRRPSKCENRHRNWARYYR